MCDVEKSVFFSWKLGISGIKVQCRSKVSYQFRFVSCETRVTSLGTRFSCRETQLSSLDTRISSLEIRELRNQGTL